MICLLRSPAVIWQGLMQQNVDSKHLLPQTLNAKTQHYYVSLVHVRNSSHRSPNCLFAKHAKETKAYELRVVGVKPFGTSAIQKLTCLPRTVSRAVYFSLRMPRSSLKRTVSCTLSMNCPGNFERPRKKRMFRISSVFRFPSTESTAFWIQSAPLGFGKYGSGSRRCKGIETHDGVL